MGSKRSLFVRCLIMRVHPTGPGRASGRLLLRVKKHGLRSSGLQHGLSNLDVSIHTFEIPEVWHRPECLRHPRVQPSHLRNWDRRHNGDG